MDVQMTAFSAAIIRPVQAAKTRDWVPTFICMYVPLLCQKDK